MPQAMLSAGVKDTSAFSADLDPNTSAPPADRVGNVGDRAENGALATGIRLGILFSGMTGTPDITVVPWILDETSGTWFRGGAVSGIQQWDAVQIANLASHRFFLQVTVFNAGGGGATDVTLYYSTY
jgi:hypothetical protein